MWETTRGLPIIAQLKVGIINKNEEQTPRIYHVNLQVRVPIFFRSVRGLSREKIGIYEYSERVFCCNFFFHDVIVNFEPTRQALYPTLHLKRDKPWAFIAVIQGHHSIPYAESRHKPDSVTPMTEIVNMWHFELYLSSKGKFLSWPWKWLIVPLISDPWDYFTCFNGISSCSSFATQQSIIDKKNKRSISRRC